MASESCYSRFVAAHGQEKGLRKYQEYLIWREANSRVIDGVQAIGTYLATTNTLHVPLLELSISTSPGWLVGTPPSPPELWRLVKAVESIPVDRYHLHLDVTGVSICHINMKLIREILAELQKHYPERTISTMISPSPWWLKGVWAIVKAFLDARTVEKVHLE